MQARGESFVAALFVEPRIFAQLELLHAAQDVRAPLALSCVATCGGARDALADGDFDFLLLSTNLYYEDDERRQLAALVQLARARGIVVMSLGPGSLHGLGLPALESLASICGSIHGVDPRPERRRYDTEPDRFVVVRSTTQPLFVDQARSAQGLPNRRRARGPL